MINRIKSLTNTEDKKRLISNFFSLSVLQGANYILPLITLPYLVNVLGVEYFGLLSFATATLTYFQILTDYGFNLTATREISIHRDNKEKVIEIFSSVMTIKVILMLVSFFLLSILVFSFEKFSQNWEVYFFTFGTVIGQVLFPVWFFQGMERMKYITYLNIVSKVIFTIAVFVVVQEQDDYFIVPILTSIGFLVAGIWSLYLVKKEFEISFKVQPKNILIHYFAEGKEAFFSVMSISLYTVSTTIILGLMTNNTIVGIYAIAERLINVVKSLITPISNTFYPYISKYSKTDKIRMFEIIRKYSKIVLPSVLAISIILFFISDWLILFVFGEENYQSVLIFEILLSVPILMTLGNIFGIHTMFNVGLKKELSKVFLYAGIQHITMCPILIYFYSNVGASISVVITEFIVTLLMFLYLQKNGFVNILIWNKK